MSKQNRKVNNNNAEKQKCGHKETYNGMDLYLLKVVTTAAITFRYID